MIGSLLLNGPDSIFVEKAAGTAFGGNDPRITRRILTGTFSGNMGSTIMDGESFAGGATTGSILYSIVSGTTMT